MLSNPEETLKTCYEVYKQYENVLNSYVADYYVENHWERLPNSWKKSFENASMPDLALLLDFDRKINKLYPLSLLCLRDLVKNNSLPRTTAKKSPTKINKTQQLNEKFLKSFRKGVKLKKRHEIEKISEICHETALKTDCTCIVDVGSGLGHLSRMLNYGYGLKTVAFEADRSLSNLAPKLDENFEKTLEKRKIPHRSVFKTVHLNRKIEIDTKPSDFSNLVRSAVASESDGNSFKFGVIGLHPCGNLGATLLKLFDGCPSVSFVNLASCCYFKMTLEPPFFPLSRCAQRKRISLGYLSCEMACHSIENYVTKLNDRNEMEKLKIHSYRAGLEKIRADRDGFRNRSSVANLKYDGKLTFVDYCSKASRDGIDANEAEKFAGIVESTWRDVVVFHSLRLLVAPLIETAILLDRLLFLAESETNDCRMVAAFDCSLSPRNHVLVAVRNE